MLEACGEQRILAEAVDQFHGVGTGRVHNFQTGHPFATGRYHQAVHPFDVALQVHVFRVHFVDVLHLFLHQVQPGFLFIGKDAFPEPAEGAVTDRLLFRMGGVQRILVTDVETDCFGQFLIVQAVLLFEHQRADDEVDRRIGTGEAVVTIENGKAFFADCGKYDVRKFLAPGIHQHLLETRTQIDETVMQRELLAVVKLERHLATSVIIMFLYIT